MFDTKQQFFPTPLAQVARMWAKLKGIYSGYSIDTLLDPSGGKGDLLDGFGQVQKFAIEIDPNLQAILRSKKITVIGSDFLTWDEPTQFDAILMNPPFNRGVDHVLRAWAILKDGGSMVALVNKETVANQCTSERQRLGLLVQQYGGWEDLGQCFKNAERSTDVEVAMLWLVKPARKIDPNEFCFTGDFRKAPTETFEEFAANPLATSDAIDSLVAQYRACLAVIKARAQAQTELTYHLNSIGGASRRGDELETKTDFFKDVQDLKYRCWWGVFRLSKMSEITTSDFEAKFEEFAQSQVHMAFDRENIMQALEIFFQNREQIMIDSVVSVFDQATKYHESNVTHPEGWKSNSGWKVNPKIVIPSGVSVCPYFGKWDLRHGSSGRRFLSDLDEVLAWIAGDEFEKYKPEMDTAAFIDRDYHPAGTWLERRHYDIKLFKKGTVHIRFKDLYLLDDFNAIAAKGKQWLGGEGF